MLLISRVLVAVIGLFSLFGSLQHWFKVDALLVERGIQAVGDIGRANIRADVGGLFIGIGLFSVIAAARLDKIWLLAAILLTGGALLGRFVSVAIDGYSPQVGPPMVIEAAVIGIYLAAFQLWGKKPEGL